MPPPPLRLVSGSWWTRSWVPVDRRATSSNWASVTIHHSR